VLIEGFRPGVMNRLSLDYASLRAGAPQLVYLSLTGYGQDGPYRDRAGHDVNYLALAGALDGPSPRPPALQTADFAAGGLFAVVAVLSSILDRTGGGRHIDLSMHEGVLSMMMLATGQAAQRLSGSFPGYGIYRTRDGRHLSVGALEPKFWKAFCAGIERADLEPRDLDPKAVAEVSRVIESRDLTFWTERFSRIDACVEPVLTPDEARVQPQALHRGRGPGFSLPFLAGGLPPPDLPRAPFLGEHTPLASDAGAEDLG
jgi:crotonobetainyl-CoA:carnitine CoA-transferase CaiB-like acyl-CoA transferase